MSPGKKTSPEKKAAGGSKGPRKQNKVPKKARAGPQQSVAIAYAKPIELRQPVIRSNGKFCLISHREPIGIIDRNAGGFSVKQFLSINPGLSTTFKWLSTQAVGWEKYMFEKLEFEYVSRTSSTTNGAILLAIDHDAADAQPTVEDVMANYSRSMEDAVWVKSLRCKAVCDNVKRFVRSSSLAANLDVKTYDLGNFISATSGVDVVASNVGKVYADYTIKFFIPQLPTNFGSPAGGTVISGGIVGQANPFGTAPTISPLAQGVDVVNSAQLRFQQVGQYLSAMSIQGAGLAGTFNTPTIASGSGTITDAGSIVAASALNGLQKSVLNITSPNTIVDYTMTLNPGIAATHTDVARSPIGALQ